MGWVVGAGLSFVNASLVKYSLNCSGVEIQSQKQGSGGATP
ncbi:unnamed protein product [marine sediment metagenome]|uniref:Uncharacterized protein n=1 Tax=marine sediment metagenome TaxID=412755 RepID=X1KYR6_9ZZZZ